MRKKLFFIFNLVYFGFNYFAVPYLPNFLVFGFMPFQLFVYIAGGPVASIVWGTYYHAFFKTQHAYFDE